MRSPALFPAPSGARLRWIAGVLFSDHGVRRYLAGIFAVRGSGHARSRDYTFGPRISREPCSAGPCRVKAFADRPHDCLELGRDRAAGLELNSKGDPRDLIQLRELKRPAPALRCTSYSPASASPLLNQPSAFLGSVGPHPCARRHRHLNLPSSTFTTGAWPLVPPAGRQSRLVKSH